MHRFRSSRTPRPALVIAVALLALSSIGVIGAPSAGAAPYCGITWGSLDKVDRDFLISSSPIVNARAGRHQCFDRLVIDLGPGEGVPGYSAGYTDRILDLGSGEPVPPLRGGISIGVVIDAPAHDGDYNPTFRPADRYEAADVRGFTTMRQVGFYSTYEGMTLFGIGVRARLPFRVFTLAGPGAGQRLVIDIAHRW